MKFVTCPDCGATYAARDSLRGLCPYCLFAAAAAGPDGLVPAGRDELPRFRAPAIEGLRPHFPHYEILALAGGGGMSAVYKARQRSVDRVVALKVLPRELSEAAGGVERFEREARTLARLNHPGVVSVYDAGQAGPWCFLAMEFVDGPNLRQLMGDSKLPPPEALRLVADICDGLQYAHDAGVVHRDLKPENVLVDPHGRAKIADFGIAKSAAGDAARDAGPATATGALAGTPRYVAPERFERPDRSDRRSDLYSVGVMLHEMLTGEPPAGHFEPPSEARAELARYDAVVRRALARDPDRRYQDARDLRDELLSAASGGRAAAADSRPPAPGGRELLLAATAAGLTFGGVAAALEAYSLFTYARRQAVNPGLTLQDAAAHAAAAAALWLVGFLVARANASRADRWSEFSLGQSLSAPVLLAGYAALGLFLPLAPAVWVCAFTAASLPADAGYWDAFGRAFGDGERSAAVARYVLPRCGAGLLASAAWTLLLAAGLWARPRLARLLFHPADEAAGKAIAAAYVAAAATVLAPSGIGLLSSS